jgi:hypothetical protein
MLALFVTFAALNATYTSIWDLLMDWSLLQPHANEKFLRDVRGYKNPYYYYAAMFLDPILRFNWIFYAIYTRDLGHSTIVSFLVGFSECTRRGIWVLFRVENEHCSNVRSFKASRDVPLPYSIPSESEENLERIEESEIGVSTGIPTSPALSRLRTQAGLEDQHTGDSTVRRRPQSSRTFTRIVAEAHTQDFEKKRKPGAGDSDNITNMERDGDFDADAVHSSDEEDVEDELDREDVFDAEGLLRGRVDGSPRGS